MARGRLLAWLAAAAVVLGLAIVVPSLFDDSLPAGTVVLVDVRSSDGIPRFAGSSEGLALDLPADVSAEVMKGADLVWSVTALDADGNATGKSASAPLSAPAAPGIP